MNGISITTSIAAKLVGLASPQRAAKLRVNALQRAYSTTQFRAGAAPSTDVSARIRAAVGDRAFEIAQKPTVPLRTAFKAGWRGHA